MLVATPASPQRSPLRRDEADPIGRLPLAGVVVAVLIVPASMTSAGSSAPLAGISGLVHGGRAPTPCAGLPHWAAGGPVYVADFETGDFSQVVSQQKVRDEAITLTTVRPLQDAYSALVKAGSADVGFGGLSNVRAEIVFERLADRFFGGSSLEGKTTWVTWEQRLDPAFEIGGWAVITQFAGGGSPVFAVEANGPPPGKLLAIVRGGLVNGNTQRVRLQKRLQLRTDLRFKVYHRWSTGRSGRVKVWLNGVLKATIKGPNLYTGYERTPYHKAGIYRGRYPAATRDSQLTIDNVRWWSTNPDCVMRAGRAAQAPSAAQSHSALLEKVAQHPATDIPVREPVASLGQH